MDADRRHDPAGRWFWILLESSMTTSRRCHDGKLPTSCSMISYMGMISLLLVTTSIDSIFNRPVVIDGSRLARSGKPLLVDIRLSKY